MTTAYWWPASVAQDSGEMAEPGRFPDTSRPAGYGFRMVTPGPENLAHLAGPEWAEVLPAAPRHLFAPGRAWTTTHELIDRHADPDTWWEAVNSDIAIVTQIDDGATELTDQSPWMTTDHTSSCSAPSFVFDFLTLLAPCQGDRVLEIGTGTGWTTALLSARIGEHSVTSVEIDPWIAEEAGKNLRNAGYAPHLITGDGAHGHPDRAPYDRVHVTCGAREIPYAWVAQSRPGGVIVLPWMHGVLGGGHKLTLTVTGDSAVGRFHGECAYMMLRDQRPEHPPIEGEARESAARVDPRRITRADHGLAVALAGMLPGVSVNGADHPDGSHRLALRHLPSGSHALAVYPAEGGDARVRQRGSLNLWDNAEAAYLAWVEWGEPGLDRFGLTVTPSGQYVWLDQPGSPLGGAKNG